MDYTENNEVEEKEACHRCEQDDVSLEECPFAREFGGDDSCCRECAETCAAEV